MISQKLIEQIKSISTLIFTVIIKIIEVLISLVIWLVKFLIPIIQSIFEFTISTLRSIHEFIVETKHPIKIYSLLLLSITYLSFASAINYQVYKGYNTMKFDYKLKQAYADVDSTSTIKENETKSLKDIISTSLTTQIEQVITSEKNLCINKEMLEYKKDIREHSFIYPSDEELATYEAAVSNGVCSVKNLQDNTYILLLKQLFGENSKLIDSYKNSTGSGVTSSWTIVTSSGQLDADFNKKIDEIKKKLQDQEVKDGVEKKISTILQGADDAGIEKKSTTKIKAIFCSYGHGVGPQGWIDEGATSRYQDKPDFNGITERTLIMDVMSGACKQMQDKVKDKGVIVYEIGKERTSLIDKIKIINAISKDKGYDEHTAIGVELHYNIASTKDRSGVEIMYSQLETPELGFFGPDLANNMLYHIKKTHNFGNLYRIKSDASSRYKSLGILSETKPTMILVEYGFLTNSKDTEFARTHIKDEQKALVDGIVSYIK